MDAIRKSQQVHTGLHTPAVWTRFARPARFGALLCVALLCCLRELLPAATVSYDIVYVRAPRFGDSKNINWADVYQPMRVEPGSDLVLLHPDGKEEVLVAAGKGAVADPCVSFDARWVYYSFIPDPATLSPVNNTPPSGADIYKINLQTRQVVRLTNQEYTPNTGVRTSPLPYGVFNMGPCPVSGGKVVFTSNRNGFIPPKQYTPVTSQLYVMDEDGSNVQAIAPMTLGASLHPYQLKDGRIAFSTQEAQGLRDQRVWALWAIWPDGRHWEPLMSAFVGGAAFHFSTQLSNGDVVIEDYYNLNNMGFGSFHRFPVTTGMPRFNPAATQSNPPIDYTDTTGNRREFRYPFTPNGLQTITPFATPFDEASAILGGAGSGRAGKVTQPSAALNNDLLLVWSGGPVNLLARPISTPLPDAGLYIARNGGPVERASDLVLVKNDPRYNELWPRAVVPYRAIYGVDQPVEFPFLPNDGTANPSLPPGTPYGIIGTSSFYKRESFPASAHSATYIGAGVTYEGLEPFNGAVDNVNSNWTIQGADAGKYSNADIAAVRILLMEPQTEMAGEGGRKFFNHVNERMRILGEIPLRKTRTDGSPVLDPDGNPDTSFWAKLPADTPITFQMLDANGRVLTMAQTWHQVRPGEVRVDCGGCHAHSQAPLAFDRTAAAKSAPVDLTMAPAHDVEYVRDIEPIVQRTCVRCHKEPMDSAPARLAFTSDPQVNYQRLANDRDAKWGIKPAEGTIQFWGVPNASRYARIFQSRRSLLMWTLYEARLDGWRNEDWPSGLQPHPQRYYMADLDYEPGTVDHRPLLTEEQRRMFSTWIDLALPIDQGGGYFRDENRPTLAISVAAGVLLIGAADGYSGLDESSIQVTVNGAKVQLAKKAGNIWSAAAPTGNLTVVARVRDRAGNWNEQTIRISGTVRSPAQRSDTVAPSPTIDVTAAVPEAPRAPADGVFTTQDGIRLKLETVATAFQDVVALAFAPDGRLFVGERSGGIEILAAAGTQVTREQAYPGEGATVEGLALDPDFGRNHQVYVYENVAAGPGTTRGRIVRYREVAGRFGQPAVLFDGIPGDPGHEGGRIRFGPDGFIYITTGSSQRPDAANDLASLAGKILRIDRDGFPPRENPYFSPVYSLGGPSPQGFDWHPASGELWVVNGEARGPALGVATRGGRQRDMTLLATRSPDSTHGGQAASAASFYRGQRFPRFVGDLFVATGSMGQLLRVRANSAGPRTITSTEILLDGRFTSVRDVVAGPDGNVYFAAGLRSGTSATSSDDQVLRLIPAP